MKLVTTRLIFCVSGALLLLSFVACSFRTVTEAETVGTYRGRFSNGLEELTLRNDGTFDETYTFVVDPSGRFGSPTGASYHNSGGWTYSTAGSGSYVLLDHAFIHNISGEPPHKIEWRLKSRRAYWPSRGIVLDWEDPDKVVKLYKID